MSTEIRTTGVGNAALTLIRILPAISLTGVVCSLALLPCLLSPPALGQSIRLGNAIPPDDERPPLDSGEWIQYMLDTCETVEDVIASDNVVRIWTVEVWVRSSLPESK